MAKGENKNLVAVKSYKDQRFLRFSILGILGTSPLIQTLRPCISRE
jgi:hypothetical protein